MTILDDLTAQVSENAAQATPVTVRIGAHWSVVSVTLDQASRTGISSTLHGGGDHHHGGRPPVRDAGQLLQRSVPELVELVRSSSLLEASVGLAALNALLDVDVEACVPVNAADVIAERGAGRNIAVVGHFPFIPRLRESADMLWVLELNPRAGDLPASEAPRILPEADVVALTGTSLLNHTFDDLIAHCRPDAFVVVLGGTTPLSSRFFAYGVDAVAGTRIVNGPAAARSVEQGATFKQIRGKQLLTLFKEPLT